MLYNFHYPKILVYVGQNLARETSLSKAINMVDGFFLPSQGFADKDKKYIDTILKLDNSKTIMLETKGGGITTKNATTKHVVDGDVLCIEFSEFLEDESDVLFVDYPRLSQVPVGTTLAIDDVTMHVINVTDAGVEVQVYQGGAIVSDRLVTFDERDPQLGYLNQKDKKDIQRGLDGGVHMIIGSYASSVARMQELRMYLDSHDSSKKIIAKIENKPGLEDIDSIAETVDGILLQRTKLMKYVSESDLCNIIARIKASGTSVYVQLDYLTDVMDAPASMDKQYQQWIVLGVDAFLLDDRIAQLEEPLPPIVALYERLADVQLDASTKSLQPFYKESDRTVIDYILYNVSHIMSDITVRAIVCYTTTGYTASRLASFRPNVPIIAFTKSDHTYRYINTLRGVKGYKVSQGFTYEKLKQVGKEMIRMMFKGSISLDEKIVLVQVNEYETDDVHQINGIELYHFKNM